VYFLVAIGLAGIIISTFFLIKRHNEIKEIEKLFREDRNNN
jgi:hypothetical protein